MLRVRGVSASRTTLHVSVKNVDRGKVFTDSIAVGFAAAAKIRFAGLKRLRDGRLACARQGHFVPAASVFPDEPVGTLGDTPLRDGSSPSRPTAAARTACSVRPERDRAGSDELA